MSVDATPRAGVRSGDLSTGADLGTLRERFRPLFERIRAGAVARETTGELAHEEIRALADLGFGAVRVPVAYGGAGASLPQLIELLTDLAEADSNIPQALRGHFALVEDRLNAHAGTDQSVWFERFVAGEIAGNAWTEVGDVAVGDVLTRVRPHCDGLVVDGRKFYATGSIYADWIDVFARRDDTGEDVCALVPARRPGVTHIDDWDGFGQRTTGSGTLLLEQVPVAPEDVIPFRERFAYQTAFYQLVLLAVLAGSARGAARDVAEAAARRTRVYSHGAAARWREDPQIQQVVGTATARGWAATAVAVRAAASAQRAYLARFGDDPHEEQTANEAAELDSAQAQVVLVDLAQRATSDVFDALGASGVRSGAQLDRHWRNARTAASHNPVVFKARIVGDWAVNGTPPPYVWQIGQAAPATG
ncbi:acyl-CoA dehydrogenase family protein [Microbacterium caowuchunii]|uniref:Monooxygenase n=1 Tax=Microbacterium caowuchunii TaxID=2614638 RepID=A0A5N0T6M1_9MICO|nr:acyl-CoA dehydrogenase family protein [Microbacterium caowuchunii]KAA9130695.1 monooxygenase [Microbacterium caowuchunii]